MKESPNRILITAMVIHPNYGSEFGFPWQWLLELCKKNVQIEVISGIHKDNREVLRQKLKERGINNIKLHFIPFPKPLGFVFLDKKYNPFLAFQTTIKYWIWHWKAYKKGLEICNEREVDIVHQLNVVGFRLPGFMGLLKKPFLWGPIGAGEQFYRDLFSHLNFRGQVYYLLYNATNFIQWKFAPYINWCFYRADVVVCTTSELVEMTKKKFLFRKQKVFHIPETACITDDIVKFPKKIKQGNLTIAVVCFFQHRKNIPFLFDAIKEIDLSKVTIRICGEGPSEAYFKAYAEKLKLTNVEWLGWKPKTGASKVIQEADVLVMPTLREANTNVIFEALAVATPVICVDVSGMRDTIINGVNGYKIRRNKNRDTMVQELQSRIVSLIESPNLVMELSEGALNSIQNNLYKSRIDRLMPFYMEAYQRYHKIY